MMDQVVEATIVNGILVGKNKIEVTHLQFLDDTLLFSTGDVSKIAYG